VDPAITVQQNFVRLIANFCDSLPAVVKLRENPDIHKHTSIVLVDAFAGRFYVAKIVLQDDLMNRCLSI